LLNNGKTIAKTVMKASRYSNCSTPISTERGAAIAKPIGLKIKDPRASKDETLESASCGTFLCKAVYQRVLHKSNVIPHKKAQNAIT
jgi:hypothetical protein